MRVLHCLLFGLGCAVAVCGDTGLCQTDAPPPGGATLIENQARMREVIAVSRKMREIEKRVTEGDEELKKLWEQIVALHKEYEEKVNAKLAGNAEYQELKKRLDALRKEWKEKFPSPPGTPNNPSPAPVRKTP